MDVVRASLIRIFPREWWAGVPCEHNIEIDYITYWLHHFPFVVKSSHLLWRRTL